MQLCSGVKEAEVEVEVASDCRVMSSLLGSDSGNEAERAEDCEELHIVKR